MLFKTLGYSSSFINLATIYMVFQQDMLTDFGSPEWTIGIGSILLLSFFSVALFYLNSKEAGLNAMKVHGTIYISLGILIYSYFAINNLINPLSFSDFKLFAILCSTLLLIGLVTSINAQQDINKTLIKGTMNVLSLLTLGITYGTIYKYIILQSPVVFNIIFIDMFMIVTGSVLFSSAYYLMKKNS